MEFPDILDGAAVLEFSDRGNYGTVEGDGRVVRYLAICRYAGGTRYYLFFCAGRGGGYDVITDDLCESLESCKASAARFGDVVWHKKYQQRPAYAGRFFYTFIKPL